MADGLRRVFRTQRPIRLSDTDRQGRLRLDGVARYLQDIAADDIADAGWEPDSYIWVVRRTTIDVRTPFVGDTRVEIATWCSGIAAAAATRHYSLVGDRGGRIEAESVWIHLDENWRPLRLGDRFLATFAPAAEGRRTTTRLELPAPTPGARAASWPMRATDIDQLGHVNNAAYWIPVEELWRDALARPLRARLEYRRPIDPGEPVEVHHDGNLVWLVAGGEVRSAASLEAAPAPEPSLHAAPA